MRTAIAIAALFATLSPAFAQPKVEPQPRYGIVAETGIFPQAAPKEVLASIAKAFDRKRIDYLLAHLVDPAFTSIKVNGYYRQRFGRTPEDDLELSEAERDARLKAALNMFVSEVNDHLAVEPKQTLRLLRLVKEGAVEEAGTSATVSLKDTPNATLTLRQVDGRWYMANDIEAAKPKADADKPK